MSITVTTEMNAILIQEGQQAAVVSAPVPSPGPNQLLIKVSYTALNPIDWKLVDFMGGPGKHLGCELTGSIVALGKDLENDNLAVGDVVAGLSDFNAQEVGTHADYAILESDMAFKVQGLGPAEAAAFPVAIATAAVGLYTLLGLPFPPKKAAESEWILVYGGSSAVGMMAIQLAKLAGYKVVSTASKANHNLIRKLGADEVFEYRDATACIKSIRAASNGKLHLAYDAIAGQSSFKICIESLGADAGGKMVHTMPMPATEADLAKKAGVTANMVLLATVFSDPAVRKIGAELFSLLPVLVAKHDLQAPPVEVKESRGLDPILSALDQLKQGQFSAKKVVMKLST